jgi:hypothetical protein
MAKEDPTQQSKQSLEREDNNGGGNREWTTMTDYSWWMVDSGQGTVDENKMMILTPTKTATTKKQK